MSPLVARKRANLDCSSVQLDGRHTPAQNGGKAVGYQGRKNARTTTVLFRTDNRGLPLSCVCPQAGNHHDTHQLNVLLWEIGASLEAATIPVAGLFLNADKAFDTQGFRQECARRNRCAADWQTDDYTPFDPELYRRRVVVEHANAWLDGFNTLLVHYETRDATGWPGTCSPLLSSFYEKSTKSLLSKHLQYNGLFHE